MEAVDLRNPDWKWFQMQLLDGKQLARNGADVFFVRAVDAITPLAGLLIQVLPTGERASGKEVAINERERPFYACGAIGIATLMSGEAKAETFTKSLHLGNRNHVGSGSAQDHNVGVINFDALGGAAKITQRIGQKDFTVETLKSRVALNKQHPRVTQHGRGGLDVALLASNFGFVR